MTTNAQFGSPSFRLVAKGLLELHWLIKDGKGDSLEAERVRDALDIPLKALSETEKTRAQWLSEDLYSISEPRDPAVIKEMNPQAKQQLDEAHEARNEGNWDRALAMFRRWGEYLPPAILSYIRGSIWEKAGIQEVATEFYRNATELDPSNGNGRAIYLHSLAQTHPRCALELARQVLADEAGYAPFVIARAAEICFKEARQASDSDANLLSRSLAAVLERCLTRIEKDVSGDREPAYSTVLALLGFLYEFSGNTSAAVECYSRGLQANPDNEGLLVARGILQYGTSPSAIVDFNEAVLRGSSLVWPYLYLAHDHLLNGRFEECRRTCEAGLQMEGSDSAKSELEEWRAIALAQLGARPVEIRKAFDAALSLDPSNDLARRNRDAFEASLNPSLANGHPSWAQKPPAALRHLGLAERRYSLVA